MTQWTTESGSAKPISEDVTDEANALPASYFTDPQIFEQELEDVFSKHWIYAGNVKTLEETGDYITRDIGGKNIILIKDDEGDINGMYNVCAHRGARVLDDADADDPGNVGAIQCPYHVWTYDYEGKLQSAPASFENANMNPDLEDEDVPNLHPEEHGLKEVSVETVGPFIFVNLDTDPDPIEDMLGSMAEEVTDLNLTQYEHVDRVVTEVDCNWKVLAGNYSECDHCQSNHQDWIREISLDDSTLEVNDYHLVLHYAYADHVDVDADEALFYYLWPNFALNIYGTADGYGTYEVYPADEDTTLLIADYYFEDNRMTEEREEMIETSLQLQREDIELVERQQDGLRSGVLEQGHLGPNEHTVHKLHKLTYDALHG
ncbi:aromatic ring-hydroxylating oxygenase subunit alpha [Haloferax profundi]|uniref:Ring-hydroxylating oxygenase subunit alpha n=1 Tax=Haloferax profundi TaxID=1544718 RepID=A0A0W1RFD4_9EURY|nr:SRPBCC family protein [Haloferax profundi]KTG12220.1 ring-hydroxylating oxygenase subunit alpha [Haloferax profundi]